MPPPQPQPPTLPTDQTASSPSTMPPPPTPHGIRAFEPTICIAPSGYASWPGQDVAWPDVVLHVLRPSSSSFSSCSSSSGGERYEIQLKFVPCSLGNDHPRARAYQTPTRVFRVVGGPSSSSSSSSSSSAGDAGGRGQAAGRRAVGVYDCPRKLAGRRRTFLHWTDPQLPNGEDGPFYLAMALRHFPGGGAPVADYFKIFTERTVYRCRPGTVVRDNYDECEWYQWVNNDILADSEFYLSERPENPDFDEDYYFPG